MAKRKRTDCNNINNKDNSKNKIKAVMFIPYTKHSELAQRMRESEEKMESMTGYRLKIVQSLWTCYTSLTLGLETTVVGLDAYYVRQKSMKTSRTAKTVGRGIAFTRLTV